MARELNAADAQPVPQTQNIDVAILIEPRFDAEQYC